MAAQVEYWINTNQLDTPLCELFPDAKTNETPRDFIKDSEKQFGMEHKDVDGMTYQELNAYIDFLDYLWEK